MLDEMRERMLREPEKLVLRKKLAEHPFGNDEASVQSGLFVA